MMRTALVRMLDGISGGAAIAVTGSKGVEMKRTFLILMILAAAQTVSAQDWAKEKLLKSPRHSEWVTVKHVGGRWRRSWFIRSRGTSGPWF